jgi:cytochrome c553
MFVRRTSLLLASVVILTGLQFAAFDGIKSTLAQPASRKQSDPWSADQTLLNGRKLAETECAACHGVDGNSTDPQFPKIAGQNPYYIHSQLRAFKSGARKSDVMSGIASKLAENQIVELASYFSSQQVRSDVVRDPQLAAIGENVFRDHGAGVPPCIVCHGGRGYGPRFGRGGMMGGHMGMMMRSPGVVPNLYGQHTTYIVQQLAAFARGKRWSSVMGPIAAAWREQDYWAVAEYLSGLR